MPSNPQISLPNHPFSVSSSPQRIFVTGASGCVGHYIIESLIEETDHELYLLVRDPDKLLIDTQIRPGVKVLQGDLRDIERFSDLLATMDTAILAAACWGGLQQVFEINVEKTLQLMNLLDPNHCQQVIYFSTESILNQDNGLRKEAGEIGTDYIRSKYVCYQRLSELAIAPRITTLFPTVVFGGDKDKPASHQSSGLAEVFKWVDAIRFFKADGSFHLIHARDIATVVRHLIDHPPAAGEPRNLVLGNPAMTANQAIEEACEYLGKRIFFRIPLSLGLANNVLVPLFRLQMAAWDRFCMDYRHFIHKNPVNPSTLGLTSYYPTLSDVLRVSGIPPG